MNQFDNSEELIDLQTSLDYKTPDERLDTIKRCIAKLAHGGQLKVIGLDIQEVSRGIYFGFLSLEDFNELLLNRKSIFSLEYMSAILTQFGLPIQQKGLRDYHYFIEAIRP